MILFCPEKKFGPHSSLRPNWSWPAGGCAVCTVPDARLCLRQIGWKCIDSVAIGVHAFARGKVRDNLSKPDNQEA